MLILEEIRCPKCNRKLMNMSGHAEIKCSKCKSLITVDTETEPTKIYVKPEYRK